MFIGLGKYLAGFVDKYLRHAEIDQMDPFLKILMSLLPKEATLVTQLNY